MKIGPLLDEAFFEAYERLFGQEKQREAVPAVVMAANGQRQITSSKDDVLQSKNVF